MSKKHLFENKAFQTPQVSAGFNLAPQVNAINSIFDIKPLDQEETEKLEDLLSQGLCTEMTTQEQASKDLDNLKRITEEVRAIGKQGVILLGERIYRAREIMKPYRNGTFSRWLEKALGSRRTGYNALSYYELYIDLPREDLKDKFKNLQQKTAYVLASRGGTIEIKAEIIGEIHNKSHGDALFAIQQRLPIEQKDKRRKTSSNPVISTIRTACSKLEGQELSDGDIEEVQKLIKRLQSLCIMNS